VAVVGGTGLAALAAARRRRVAPGAAEVCLAIAVAALLAVWRFQAEALPLGSRAGYLDLVAAAGTTILLGALSAAMQPAAQREQATG
jgi:hypothetical protein